LPTPDPAASDNDLAAALLERAAAHARAGRVAQALAQAREAMSVLDRRAAAAPDAPPSPGELPGRAQLEAAADRLAAQQPGVPQLLLVAGLDRLGVVNATWSRAGGDAVLRACAAVLRAQSRPQDVLARLDGDRFAFLPAGAVSTTRALMVAERLRAAIHAHDWAALQPGLAVSASVGVAARAPGEPLGAALARAEAALARCKREGRDQVRSAD
jgi:diguanylate cyclase (GGDEF)-like protein